jgi:two-component system chemotaxis response regulator CheY
MKILIVDDSQVMRRAIERAIGSEHEVRTAGDGEEALRVFDEFGPDVVTMDITMPKMDGLTCVDELLQRKKSTRILVVSALADVGTAVTAVKRGAHGFLTKPFTPESIAEELKELLQD